MTRDTYSWFNRLVALRYLDAKGWHPFGCKVLMPATGEETQPELLKLIRSGSLPSELKKHANEARLNGLLDGQIPTAITGADPQGEVFRELVLAVCRSYHQLLPNLFEELDDATELLLPDDLITETSIAAKFRSSISDDDCQDVEIIGWLYQFYISEKKDQVIGKVVKSEDIPAATQLFTPNWIVKYMVQNSLGAQWLATYPGSAIKGQMEYYIEPAEQTEEVKAQLAAITPSSLNPEELTLIDPACGSGHILVEAYELFKAIYLERGYQLREIAQLILEKNLFGLDLDERAAQLTSFALMMKGRSDDRRLFDRGVKLNVMALVNSDGFDAVGLANVMEISDYGLKLADLTELKQLFEYATTFGSLIQVPEELAKKLPALKQLSEAGSSDMILAEALKWLGPLVQQAEMLEAKYDAVVANPPYMGSRGMCTLMKTFAAKNYPESKSDLFACFIERTYTLSKSSSRIGMVTMQGWMFLSSFQKLRERMLREKTLESMAHIGFNSFPSMNSKIALATTFTLSNRSLRGYTASFIDLTKAAQTADKGKVFLEKCPTIRYEVATEEFEKVPGAPVAYSVSDNIRSIFKRDTPMRERVDSKVGLQTSDNDRFVRRWPEVSIGSIGLHLGTSEAAELSHLRWFPYNKGGDFRRWYGNHEFVVNWMGNGKEVKEYITQRYPYLNGNIDYVVKDRGMFFRESVSWSDVTFVNSFRYYPTGFIYAQAGPSAFFKDVDDCNTLIAFCNSNLCTELIAILNPAMHFDIGYFDQLPWPGRLKANSLQPAVESLIKGGQDDWDAYERSWGFQSFPLLQASTETSPTLEASYTAWIRKNKETITEMKSLEEENNRLFINAYGLADELNDDVPIEQITLTVNPAYRYGDKISEEEQWTRFRSETMEELLSYALGCMMGRYSLDAPGLIYANSGNEGFDPSKYPTFPADADAIIPVLDGEWFDDDIVARSRNFLRVAFPGTNLTDNLKFLEQSLGKDIRKYFTTDFYKDHLQTYKKRPIYWLVQSPKKSFACLIYLHRYTKDTLNLVLNNYLRPYIQKLEARLAQLGLDQLNDDLPAKDRATARKEGDKISKALRECQDWEREALLPLAQQRIELDLDDGVKVNYLKLQAVLAPIPGLAAKEE